MLSPPLTCLSRAGRAAGEGGAEREHGEGRGGEGRAWEVGVRESGGAA